MMRDDVLESRIVREEEVIGLADSDSYCLVKVDDFVLICGVWISSELTGHILLIFFEFLSPMGVHEENSSRVSDVSDDPFAVDADFFGRFAATPS